MRDTRDFVPSTVDYLRVRTFDDMRHPPHELARVRLEPPLQIGGVVRVVFHLRVKVPAVRLRLARPVGAVPPTPESAWCVA